MALRALAWRGSRNRWVWLGVILVLAGINARFLVPKSVPFSLLSVLLWLLTIAAFFAVIAPRSGTAGRRLAWWRVAWRPNSQIVGLGFILLVALSLRLIWLEDIPPLFHGDEGEMGSDAIRIARGLPDMPWFFGTGWFEHPSLHFYLQALSIKVFGETVFAVRLVPAFWGTFGVLATYLAGHTLFGRRVGVIAAAIAAAAPIDLHFSRLALNNMPTAVLGTLAITACYAGLRRIRATPAVRSQLSFWSDEVAASFGLAGVLAGASLYFYFGSRVIPGILVLIGGLGFLAWRSQRAAVIRGMGVLFLGATITVLPLFQYFLENPERSGQGRTAAFFLFNQTAEAQARLDAAHLGEVLFIQARRSLLQFLTIPDRSTFVPFGEPILTAPVAALFLAGLVGSTLLIFRLPYAVLAVWFWVTLIAGNVLIVYAPYTPRLVGALPAAYILAALPLGFLFQLMVRSGSSAGRRALSASVTVFLVALTLHHYHKFFNEYFADQLTHRTNEMASFIADLPSSVHVYNLPDGTFINHGAIRYLAYGQPGEDLKNPAEDLHRLVPPSDVVAFIIPPRWEPHLSIIEQRFPGGRTEVVTNQHGQPLFTTYVVQP